MYYPEYEFEPFLYVYLIIIRHGENAYMGSPGGKYSGCELLPHTDLRAGTALRVSKNRIKKSLRIETLELQSLYKTGVLQKLVRETDSEMYGMDILAMQEFRWDGQDSIDRTNVLRGISVRLFCNMIFQNCFCDSE